jgi:hypothetical protein
MSSIARVAVFLVCCGAPIVGQGLPVHVVQVVDDRTNRGIPLIQLCTTSNACFISDSQGIIALHEPAFWNHDVYFLVTGDGYLHPPDFFGDPATTVRIKRGGRTTLKMKRTNIAERLYRVTGEGIYRDSIIADLKVPIANPAINARVTGLDTVMYALYRGRIFWLFGDTANLSAALGNFATTCAQSDLPARGGLDPERGIDLKYWTRSDGFVKPMAAIPGDGLKWLFALMVVPDETGIERLIARYDRVKNLDEVHESGLAVFNDRRQQFEPLVSFGKDPKLAPAGRPTVVSVEGRKYFYFSSPYPTPVVRVPAEWQAIQDPKRYETFACRENSCKWTNDADPARASFVDIESGSRIEGTAGSVFWNAYRNRWVAIVQRNVGEVWYAEADTPTGPWGYAKKILQHDRYTFYWPGHLPFFDRDGGRRVYIMGTYTEAFSGNPVKTPRYDYNQIMYAVSLDDPRLFLPVAEYRVLGRSESMRKEEVDRFDLWDQVEGVVGFTYPAGRRPAGTAETLPNPDPRPLFDRGVKPMP